ncbi:CsbD family protein [Pseudonocardia abyssalis]|uniref:CsbD family protein n=1 Tax=Pseudonocardia abyssalis TaxID=2792008 RepID=A0ABS6ULL2_9PSEU|nr:CsbD family protein [Pseudonocardia abyssalis]MBW0116364.1 CsbD family protein [Pseudonocardia abyssalis]MBW0133147.1 CsbD family protein [Pseudonocardia abyssalis]
MSFVDKAKNKVEETLGKGKVAAGEATDDKDLKRDGQADQGKANVKQAGEHVKDAVRKP